MWKLDPFCLQLVVTVVSWIPRDAVLCRCDHVTPSLHSDVRRLEGLSTVYLTELIRTMTTPLTNDSVDILEVDYTPHLTIFKTHICFRLGCSWTGVHPSPTTRPSASGYILQPRTKNHSWRGLGHSAWTSFGGYHFCSSIGWFLEGGIRSPSPVVAHPISWSSWKGWEGAAKMGINPCHRERGNCETEGVRHPWWTRVQHHATTSRRKLAKCWSAYKQRRPHC